jgi:hypothetical protein
LITEDGLRPLQFVPHERPSAVDHNRRAVAPVVLDLASPGAVLEKLCFCHGKTLRICAKQIEDGLAERFFRGPAVKSFGAMVPIHGPPV